MNTIQAAITTLLVAAAMVATAVLAIPVHGVVAGIFGALAVLPLSIALVVAVLDHSEPVAWMAAGAYAVVGSALLGIAALFAYL